MITARRHRALLEKLADERGRRVVFLSHCLLNQNVRYPGGAFRAGAVDEVVQPWLRGGVGLCQMPCPEARAWGGVLKRLLLPAYGSRGTLRYALRGPLLRLFLLYTRWVYGRLAARVAAEIADYLRSGFEVVAVVGIGGSPSCGVRQTLDLRRSLPVVASCPVAEIDRQALNRTAVAACMVSGEGLFVRALRRRLARRRLAVAFLEHSLLEEMGGAQRGTLSERSAPSSRATPESTT